MKSPYVVIEGSVAFLPVIERSVPPTPTPTPPPPTEIEISTNSQNAYQLQLSESGNGLSTGKKVYTDRDYRYSSVPESLRGVTYVQTANDDSVKYDLALMVSVNRPFLLYVAHSDDQIPKPSWLNPYRDTGENLTFVDNNDETVVLSVYSTVFSAGTAVLGANTPPNGDDHSMYTVAIQVVEGVGSADSD